MDVRASDVAATRPLSVDNSCCVSSAALSAASVSDRVGVGTGGSETGITCASVTWASSLGESLPTGSAERTSLPAQSWDRVADSKAEPGVTESADGLVSSGGGNPADGKVGDCAAKRASVANGEALASGAVVEATATGVSG